MKSLCLFIHYHNSTTLPYYVQVYVNELANHFDEVVIVHNERHLENKEKSLAKNVSLASFPNKGYDFGLFYRYFSQIDPDQYSQIACVNDSNVLLNELSPVFKWSKKQEFDFWGLLDSNEKPWFSTHENNYHIQSHFLVFNKKAIDTLIKYLSNSEIELIFKEDNPKKLRRLVIDQWEIGLSRYLFEAGLKGNSFINSEQFLARNNIKKTSNLAHKFYAKLIEAGMPIIKKKVILTRSWKNSFRSKPKWEVLLRKYGNKEWNLEALIDEMKNLQEWSSKNITSF